MSSSAFPPSGRRAQSRMNRLRPHCGLRMLASFALGAPRGLAETGGHSPALPENALATPFDIPQLSFCNIMLCAAYAVQR